MNRTEAANDARLRPGWEHDREDRLEFEVPKGHVGPLVLSDTGRMVWWTGRVAIGLRYQPPRYVETQGQSAEWIQKVLLKCG